MLGIEQLFGGSPQHQGSLAAIAQILQASGPQRTPQSLYSILGSGLMAGQQATQQARELEQITQLRDFAIRDKKSDYEAQEAQRARAKNLLELNAAFQKTRGGQRAAAPVDRSANAVFRGMMGGGAPQVEAPGAAMQPSMLTGQPGAGGNNRGALVQQRLDYAQYLRDNGYGAEAQAEEDSALKLQPKVKGWEKVQVGGKVMFAPFFEDGSNGQPVPLEVAEKLDSINRGGSTDLVNPFTGATVRTLANSASPDAKLTAQTAANRLAFDRSQVGRPVFNAEMGGFITLPTKANPNGGMIPLAGMEGRGPKMTEDQAKATGWLVQAENAWKNMKAVGVGEDGKPTAAARPGFADAVTGFPFVGQAIGNSFRSADRQKFVQSSSSLSEALLRAATGAGVTKEEAVQKVQEITPVWGEDEATTKQKLDAVPLYIESLKARAGPGAKVAGRVADTFNKPAGGGWSIQRVD